VRDGYIHYVQLNGDGHHTGSFIMYHLIFYYTRHKALQSGWMNSSLRHTEQQESKQILSTTFIYRKEVFIQDEANI
jgi:hypothetical protein